ncbi:MAG TPA: hypothetical protein VMG82_20320 [Candidatus Sulfotelmatobacter sp.]|nr:hypothetical protein [Candidatus Sulfotelmatobacter sp.]
MRSLQATRVAVLSSLSLGRLIAILLLLAFATPLFAEPMTYLLFVHRMNAPAPYGSVGPSGTLNGVSFGANNNAVMTFVFRGDSSSVVPWSFGGSSGYENVTGTASFQINDSGTGSRIGKGTFLASDGIFVSTDTFFGGVGFGSGGGIPGSAQFPGNPVYPYGMVVSNSYALSGPITLGPLNSADSCINFPFVCAAPTPLATTSGSLVVNNDGNGQLGFFFAMPGTATPFSNFKARSTVDPGTGDFAITGRFRPATRGIAINPTSQPVTLYLQVLMYEGLQSLFLTIPSGSFTQVSEDRVYEFSGSVPGGTMTMSIRHTEDNNFSFNARGSSTNLVFPYFAITPYPDAFFLSIGNSAGETVPVPLLHHPDNWQPITGNSDVSNSGLRASLRRAGAALEQTREKLK